MFRALRDIIVITVIGLIVWGLGPWLTVGEHHPLTSAGARQWVIGALTAFWLLARITAFWRRRRFQRNLRRQLHSASPALTPESRDASTLEGGFKRALGYLKRYHGQNGLVKPFWLPRRSRARVYNLPWYLVVGAAGSGKTKTLENAGLALLDRLDSPDAPTKACDWYFTPQGVLISPASDILDDGARWQRLLVLLKRYRARQPLNGVALILSAQHLAQAGRDEHYRHAGILRRRLLELRRGLNIDLPVYIVITKADCLAGFSQYFSRFDGPELEQPWGIGFPWREKTDGEVSLTRLFDEGYDRLLRRLNDALADTLLAEHDPRLRTEIFVLPQAVAALRPSLQRYLDIIFAPSHDGPIPAPRGVWFTSANQKTSAAAGATPACRGDVFDYRFAPMQASTANDAATPPQSYFLKALFRDIIFAESALAGVRRWSIYRPGIGQIAGCGLACALLLTAAGYCVASYHNNCRYLDEVGRRTLSLEQVSAAILGFADPALSAMLPFFNTLAAWAENDRFDYRHPPLEYRMGLYRGHTLHDAGQLVYQHALKRTLLPRLAQQISTALSQADFNDADYTYQALKAYQMLYQPQYYDSGFLLSWARLTLAYMPGAAELDAGEREQLQRHLVQLIAAAPLLSPFEQDQSLIESAQNAISRRAPSERAYQRLKHRLLRDGRFNAPSLLALAGDAAEHELARKSGLALTESLAGLFTPEGYWQGLQPLINETLGTLQHEDAWVLNQPMAKDNSGLADSVRYWYVNDFIRQWDDFLADIALKPAADLNRRIISARVMSGEHSPLRNLVTRIAPILALSPPAALPNVSRRIGVGTGGMLDALLARPTPSDEAQSAELLVRNHYRDIIELGKPRDENGGGVAFDDIVLQMGGLYRYLVALQKNDDAPANPGDTLDRLRADALRLPKPLRGLVLELADGAGQQTRRQTVQRLRQLFTSQISGHCRNIADGRYPLSPQSAADISPDDLARLFAPQTGLASRFWQQHLADKVNTGVTPWRLLFVAEMGNETAPDPMLMFFQTAQYIADAFFPPGSSSSSFSFTLRPVDMDNDILSLTLDMDGQTLSYSHGSPDAYRFNWPGPRRSGKALLSVTLADGSVKMLERQGAWALHRLLDCSQRRSGSQPDARRYTFSLAGHKATLEIVPDSVRNPFSLPPFNCAAKPEPL